VIGLLCICIAYWTIAIGWLIGIRARLATGALFRALQARHDRAGIGMY
jgi:hypothetical protein